MYVVMLVTYNITSMNFWNYENNLNLPFDEQKTQQSWELIRDQM